MAVTSGSPGQRQEIKVSVLMFVYNQAQYLARAIRSVVGQETDFAFEILIHDDASTDGSAEIIRRFAAQYPEKIIPILQKENQMSRGVSIVDRFLMPRVRGTYIAHCEGDDFWTSRHKLAEQAAFLDAHPDFAGVCHNCVFINGRGQRIRPVERFYPFRRAYTYTLADLVLEERMPGQTASIMYRHRVQTELRGEARRKYEALRILVGDRRRTLLILLNGPVFCMPRVMSAYRYETESGESWNARTHKKNLTGRMHRQEMDFRTFAAECFGQQLKNDYVLFGTGVMAFLRYVAHPSRENAEQLSLVIHEHGSIQDAARFLCEMFPGAFRTLIRRFWKKAEWNLL